MNAAAPFIAFGVALILFRLRNRGRPQSPGLASLPPRARVALVAAWLLGLVGILGTSPVKALGLAMLPAGLLLLACAWYLRGWEAPNNKPGWVFAAGTAIIGLAWIVAGVSTLVHLTR